MGAGASARIHHGLLMGDKLEKMAHSCESLFEDDEFDPTLDAALLGPRFHVENPELKEEDIIWLRPKEFGPGTLYCTGDQPLDSSACLGAIDGCNKDLAVVMQAICCRRPDYLRNVFVSYNAIVGCCAVRVYYNGRIEIIVVDDRIPCRRKTPPPPGEPPHRYGFEPVSCRLTTGEAWLPLLEKALAKLHGSYTATALGDGARDLFRDVCGGEHVLDINLASMQPSQLHTLFLALQSRFSRSELLIVARKSHTSSRTWAKRQRCNSVFNLVLHDDRANQGRDCSVNSYGIDISQKPANQQGEFANTLPHVVDQYGDLTVSQIYANPANTGSQSIPTTLFDDVLQQPQILTKHFDDIKHEEAWDDRRFFVCVSQDEFEEPPVDVEARQIAYDLKHKMEASHGGSSCLEAHAEFQLLARYQPEWLSWQRFCEDFEQLVVCVVPQEGHPCSASSGTEVCAGISKTMKSAWDPAAGTAGGGRHLKTWRNSPLFRISLTNNRICRGRLLITTSLTDLRKDSYFSDLIPDLDRWDGTQYLGGSLLYPAHALFVCNEEPTLTQVLVNTDYCAMRDVTVEMDLDLTHKGNFNYVLVPCTYADEIRCTFYLTAVFIDEEGKRSEVLIEPLEVWPGYNYTAKVSGQWSRGVSAMGPISKYNMFSFLNPTWRMIIEGPSHVFEDEESSLGKFSEDGKVGDPTDEAQSERPRSSSPLLAIPELVENTKSKSLAQGSQFSAALGDPWGLVDSSSPAKAPANAVAGTEIFAANMSTDKLTYNDVDKLNQSSLVSVPSNDTGPYSKSRLRRRDDKPSVRHFQICTLLSPSTEMNSSSRGNSPARSRPSRSQGGQQSGMRPSDIASQLPRSGTYLLTPNAYSKLLHNRGECGVQHVNDGFLGKFRYNAYPVTTRHEKFCVFSGGIHGNDYLHRGSDVYEELFIMPCLNDKDQEGSFTLEVICNLPFRLEQVEHGTVPAPLKDVANIRGEIMNTMRKAKHSARTSRSGNLTRSMSEKTSLTNTAIQTVVINDNSGSENLDASKRLRIVDKQGIAEFPNYGQGPLRVPSFERDVLTTVIKTTTLDGALIPSDGAELVADKCASSNKAGHSSTQQISAGTSNNFAKWDQDTTDGEPLSPSIRDQLPMLRKSLAKQIKADTEKKLNSISISMMSNEIHLADAIKAQYARTEEAKRLGQPIDSSLQGPTMFYEPFHDRSGAMLSK